MAASKTYEEKITNLRRIIQKQRIENSRLEARLAAVLAERDALRRLVNNDK